jgi:hypothetical protein
VGLAFVTAGLAFVIAGLALSLRATTRNPVAAWHWIPDVETPDLIRGRDDIFGVWDGNWGVHCRPCFVTAGLALSLPPCLSLRA